MAESQFLTAAHYGYGHRRIHRDDLARVLARLLPIEGSDRLAPETPVAVEDLSTAAKLCSHLSARFPDEHLGEVAETVARQLRHPATRGGAGQLLLYPAVVLCQEQQALAAAETAISVAAILEERAARQVASALEPSVSTVVRYTAQTMFNGDFVRTGDHAAPA